MISIHALREEGDQTAKAMRQEIKAFLSTPSARRATCGVIRVLVAIQFLSTPSARRATRGHQRGIQADFDFYPRPPRGGRQLMQSYVHAMANDFYPRPPRGGRQQKQRENSLLLSHYTPLCTNCKEVPLKQTAKSHRYLHKRLVFRCEAFRKTMCASCSHWRGIKRSAHYPAQTPGAAQRARP